MRGIFVFIVVSMLITSIENIEKEFEHNKEMNKKREEK